MAIQDALVDMFSQAARAAAPDFGLDPKELPIPEIERPRVKEHGDWSTNLALVLAPKAKRSPRQVAEAIAANVRTDGVVTKVEVAGPGFVNVFLKESWLADALAEILEQARSYGRRAPTGRKVQVEYVSANPTGPLHIGHARNAALGDAIANVLEATGDDVQREYYCNDAGHQMELFGRSVDARLLQLHGRPAELPEDGYAGDYVKDLAAEVDTRIDRSILDLPEDERWPVVLATAVPIMLATIEATLRRFGVRFDSYFSERTLHDSGEIDAAIAKMREAGYVYDADGAVWFASTKFGDDKDRVLIRSNLQPTYFAADCAYVFDKFGRGFDHLIYVWGADHHGDVVRVKGAARALGFDPDATEIVLHQFVAFRRGGQPVQMSKRTGQLLTLDELIDEVGADAARYTLLTRSADSAMEFDIDEVKRQTMENPVYYVQYAHARISSLLRRAQAQGVELPPWRDADFGLLQHESEGELIRTLTEFPEVVGMAARNLSPHRLTKYAEEVAAGFHRFYTDCRVISEDLPLTVARLWLSSAVKQVVGGALDLIGVSAPDVMKRISDDGTDEGDPGGSG
jgi:arginyl-tRNA synthetase